MVLDFLGTVLVGIAVLVFKDLEEVIIWLRVVDPALKELVVFMGACVVILGDVTCPGVVLAVVSFLVEVTGLLSLGNFSLLWVE